MEEAVKALFLDVQPEVVVRYDDLQQQLVVVGNETQIAQVEKTIKQFELPQRSLEVFVLEENDPRSVQRAISELFGNATPKEKPSVSIDEGTAQVFVRATDEQLVKIRELLIKLGERIGETGRPAGRVRSLPASDRLEDALEQVREVWPTLRPESHSGHSDQQR